MSRKAKPLSMMQSCEVFQRRNGRIFGERPLAEQQEPSKVASNWSLEKDRENPPPLKNSRTRSNHLPPVNERQTRRSRSRSKVARASQQQVSQFPNIQRQQRQPQQSKMVTAKPSVAPQNDVEEMTERSGGRAAFKGDTMIHRPRLAHGPLAVPGTRTTIPQNETKVRHLKPETVLARHEPSESKQSTEKQKGATKQKQKARAYPMLAVPGTILSRKVALKKGTSGRHFKPPTASAQHKPRETKQSIGNNQSATKQQQKQKARDDLIYARAGRRVAVTSHVMRERNQETSEQCCDRRIALCVQTDPAQQYLTFIRVLRKRF